MNLGFDIGGSSIKSVAVKKNRIILSKTVPLPKDWKGLLKAILEIRDKFLLELNVSKFEKIGFSFPGPLDKKREKVVLAPNIPYLNGKPLRKILSRKLGCEVKIEHDIHCFLLAEKTFGLAGKYKNVFYLTLGTGVGGAFTVNDEMIIGAHGSAGEFGHMIVDISAGRTLEDLGASKFIRKELKMDVFRADQKARLGNKKAQKVFGEMGRNIGVGIANVINILDPEIVVINGGLIDSKKFFESEMRRATKKFVLSPEAKKTKVVFSKLGRFGGAMGAAMME